MLRNITKMYIAITPMSKRKNLQIQWLNTMAQQTAKTNKKTQKNNTLENVIQQVPSDCLDGLKRIDHNKFSSLSIEVKETLLKTLLKPEETLKIESEETLKNIFYKIDVLEPFRSEFVPPTNSIHDGIILTSKLPEEFKPEIVLRPGVNLKTVFPKEKNVKDKDSFGRYVQASEKSRVFVFSWLKKTSASDNAKKYYHRVRFMPFRFKIEAITDERYRGFDSISCEAIPNNVHFEELERAVKRAVKRTLDKIRSGMVDVKTIGKEATVKEATVTEATIKEAVKEATVEQLEPMETTMTIMQIQLGEVHMSDLYSQYIQHVFKEFVVQREDTLYNMYSPFHIYNTYSPFHKSRKDFMVFRRQDVDASDKGAAISIKEDVVLDDGDGDDDSMFATVEAKMDMKENDKFQLLANMELTATHIAANRLNNKGDIGDSISVYGALIDYKKKNGFILHLTMDFLKGKSKIKQSQEINSLSEIFNFLFSRI